MTQIIVSDKVMPRGEHFVTLHKVDSMFPKTRKMLTRHRMDIDSEFEAHQTELQKWLDLEKRGYVKVIWN